MMTSTRPLWCDVPDQPVPGPTLAPETKGFLNLLRFTSMNCRAKPRAHLFEACALLQNDRTASREAHAEALMRCLNEALGKPAKLYAPGVADVTFDEAWLMQLGLATARQDEPSICFLLSSRVAREHRRLVRFLVTQISKCFALN